MKKNNKSCLFCSIVSEEIPSKKVYLDDNIYAFNDINPVAKTHILIIPKEHLTKLSDLKNYEILGQMINTASQLAKKLKISSSGYRLVINQGNDAGQEVEHLHCHLLGGSKLSTLK